jgi:DNA-binding protein HU-beta
MNKSELVSAVAQKSELTKVDAKKALDAVLEAIGEELKNDGKVVLVGFGTFSVTERSARKGINPRTKEPIDIPAKKVVKFKAGSELSAL